MCPRLSVIIPSRNALDTLPRAVQSALAVSVAALEVIIVDDGSSDGTATWATDLAQRDPRVVLLRRFANHGASAARNNGIAVARGAVLGFLDADDVWFPDAIARRLAWHEAHPTTAFSFSNYRTLLPDGSLQDRYIDYNPRFQSFMAGRGGIAPMGRDTFALLVGGNPVCTSSVLASRDAVLAAGGFDPVLRQAEDWDLWLRLTSFGDAAVSTEVEALHANRPGSLSSAIVERLHCVRTVLYRHRAEAWRHGMSAGLGLHGALAVARAELALHRNDAVGVLLHNLSALGWQPSGQRIKDAARAALVVAGVKAPLRHAQAHVQT